MKTLENIDSRVNSTDAQESSVIIRIIGLWRGFEHAKSAAEEVLWKRVG
jgi:hypothetical protein